MYRTILPTPHFYTPWGCPNSVDEVTDGVLLITTPSHGGLMLSEDVQQRLPADFRATLINGPKWAEEDCEMVIVMALLDLPCHWETAAKIHEYAIGTVRMCPTYAPALKHLEAKEPKS